MEAIISFGRSAITRIASSTVTIVVRVGTLPYYRLFYFNTVGVLQRIAIHGKEQNNFKILKRLITSWRERKLDELQFISIACAVLSGAVIGSFSWFTVQDAFWVALACWYSSLVFAILGILLSAQQIAVLKFLGPVPDHDADARSVIDRYKPLLIEPSNASRFGSGSQSLATTATLFRPKRSMVFVWQCPIMLMSYSACLFLLGLTLLVITPLIKLRERGWGSGANTAIFYLAASSLAGSAFTFCSYWIYHFVDFDSALSVDAGETRAVARPDASSGVNNGVAQLNGQMEQSSPDPR